MELPVYLIKLVNNLDLVGRVKDENSDGITFSKLRQLVYQQIGQALNIGFQHFMPAAEDADLIVRTQHIVVMLEAPNKIADGYRQATSPIQLARTMPMNGGRIIEQ